MIQKEGDEMKRWEMKPCPFCGGRVYPCYASKQDRHYMLHYGKEGQPKGWDGCSVEAVVFKKEIRTLGEAMDAWNRRAEDAAKGANDDAGNTV